MRLAGVFAIIQAVGWPIWPLLLASVIALALIVYSYRRFHGDPEAVRELRESIHEDDKDDEDDRQTRST